MNRESVSRRGFASRLAALISGLGIARLLAPAPAEAQEAGSVRKLDYDARPMDGTQLFTPLILHGGLLYIAGQGAHSRDKSDFPMDIATHTRKVMDNVKKLVETGGGAMDSILQMTVFLSNIENYDGMNKVFQTYFPHGGPARTCVAVAALPGQSLLEINCIAAVTRR